MIATARAARNLVSIAHDCITNACECVIISVRMEEIQTSPRVTALIVSRNSAAALRRCLTALGSVAGRETLEIVVVDNGSQDGSQTIDSEFPEIHMMRLPKNFGATKALNAGIRTARGEYVLLLPPDVEVRPDTIEILVTGLEADSDAGAVCAYLEQSFPLPSKESLAEFWKSGQFPGAKPVDPSAESVAVDYVIDAPMLVRRSLLIGMNYFDAKFGEFGPDAELCYRVRSGGKKILVIPAARVTREVRIEREDGPLDSADRALGAATYLRKREGFGSALKFRMSAIFHVLGRIVTFRSPGYDFQRLTALISGQKIDGTQV
jgi:N-acetylglucosaminyl-diphospho-decaprenol L-rhamnosyltransferase